MYVYLVLLLVQQISICTKAPLDDANLSFPTPTNANEHALLALGADHVGRDGFEISVSLHVS